jgi:HPt (histidine-containing phosphotransfer) domain-containing protein
MAAAGVPCHVLPMPDVELGLTVPALHESTFRKMAVGDLSGFRGLAREFFEDTRNRLPAWRELNRNGELPQLALELHRCKGAAALFGFHRLIQLVARWEQGRDPVDAFDFSAFSRELQSAESALARLVD